MTYSHYDFKYIDVHSHFFPPEIFKAIWRTFEIKDKDGNARGWTVKYKLSTEDLVKFLESRNIEAFTTLNYAHKKGVANFINEWVVEFIKKYKNAIPFACVWPDDEGRVENIRSLFEDYNFRGIKIQPLVQNFYPNDERMYKVYDLILDRGKWISFHIGTAPQRNRYVGYKNFKKFLDKYPSAKVIVAHMGAFEYKKFLNLLDTHENIYLDTTMIYIPNNIFNERENTRPNHEELLSYQDRILYGSDFPNIPYEYERSTQGLLELDLSRDFYENIFYNNAKKLFNISDS